MQFLINLVNKTLHNILDIQLLTVRGNKKEEKEMVKQFLGYAVPSALAMCIASLNTIIDGGNS